MIIEFNGEKWRSGKWLKLRYTIVKSHRHELWEYVKSQQEKGNQDIDDFGVSYFKVDGLKLTLDDLFLRHGIMGFDAECKVYPPCINCWNDYRDIYNPLYLELDEYGENLRIWKKEEKKSFFDRISIY